jgi:hypothetical protein
MGNCCGRLKVDILINHGIDLSENDHSIEALTAPKLRLDRAESVAGAHREAHPSVG